MEIQFLPTEPQILFILLLLYFFTAATQLFYYWFFFARLAFYKKPAERAEEKPVSVVISAKNEYHNLKKNLPLILEQDHPDYEVIVVNDASDDESSEFLQEMEEKYAQLKVVTLHQNLNFFSGKKFPLSLGIRSAKNELILLTDADCRPAGNQWIRLMASRFLPGTEVVLGYGPYEKRRGFLNRLIRFDTFHIAVQYLSFSLSGNTYMGVGRNLAYQRSLFYRQKGFTSHYQVASGDDDLFINKVADKHNTAICIENGAHTISKPNEKFLRWFRQKRRHLSTGKLYRPKFKFLLGIYNLSLLLFLILFVFLLTTAAWPAALSVFIFRMIQQLIIIKKCSSKLNERDLLVFSPLLEIILILTNLALGFTNLFSRKNTWK